MEEKLGIKSFMIVLEEVNSLNTYVMAILIKICDQKLFDSSKDQDVQVSSTKDLLAGTVLTI
jgi:sigma54-dependent transcription regulator